MGTLHCLRVLDRQSCAPAVAVPLRLMLRRSAGSAAHLQ